MYSSVMGLCLPPLPWGEGVCFSQSLESGKTLHLLQQKEYGERDAISVLIIAFKWPLSFYFCLIESLQLSKMSIITWILQFRKLTILTISPFPICPSYPLSQPNTNEVRLTSLIGDHLGTPLHPVSICLEGLQWQDPDSWSQQWPDHQIHLPRSSNHMPHHRGDHEQGESSESSILKTVLCSQIPTTALAPPWGSPYFLL